MAARVDPRVSWIVAHMQQHMPEPLVIDDLARLVNLSPSRFRALFIAQTGVAPVHYLHRLRLRRARLLLEQTLLSVKEVMALVGYNDPSHFSRDFRRQHGASPTTFRGAGLAADVSGDRTPSPDPPKHRRNRPGRARDPSLACA